jgi:hypothetical protein
MRMEDGARGHSNSGCQYMRAVATSRPELIIASLDMNDWLVQATSAAAIPKS